MERCACGSLMLSSAAIARGAVRASMCGSVDVILIVTAGTRIVSVLRAGAPGIHFYTLNKANSTVQVLKNLGLASQS